MKIRNRMRGVIVLALACLLSASGLVLTARAESGFFATRCATCHYHMTDSATCNGCHHHRGNLSAAADHAQYYPGDPVAVTFQGGNQHGWIRALLYDQNNTEIDRESGPTGTGDDGQGNPVVFPVALHGVAPAVPGDYTWQAAWFGDLHDDGLAHGENRTNVVIHVVDHPSGTPIPAFLRGTWGKIKKLFT